jgi:hypothetical protein
MKITKLFSALLLSFLTTITYAGHLQCTSTMIGQNPDKPGCYDIHVEVDWIDDDGSCTYITSGNVQVGDCGGLTCGSTVISTTSKSKVDLDVVFYTPEVQTKFIEFITQRCGLSPTCAGTVKNYEVGCNKDLGTVSVSKPVGTNAELVLTTQNGVEVMVVQLDANKAVDVVDVSSLQTGNYIANIRHSNSSVFTKQVVR